MAPKESFSGKQLRLKQQQEAEVDEATAERIEREMAEEINAQAEQNAFRSLGMDGQDGSFPFCLSIIFRPWDDHDDPTT
jgi:hypothetical protein